MEEIKEFEEGMDKSEEEYIGKLYGVSERNATCVTYQSKTHPGLLYVFNIYRRSKKNALICTFRCAGCRQAYDNARTNNCEHLPRVCCIRGTIDYENRIVKFHEDPDTERHGDCRRRIPHKVKATKLNGDIKNQIKESGIAGSECLDLIKDKILEKDKNDADYVLQELGTSETVRKRMKRAARPGLNCMPATIDNKIQKSSLLNCPLKNRQENHQQNAAIHPFFGQQQLDCVGIRQMLLHQPIRPKLYQNQFYQLFTPPQMLQQPPRVNLNQSLPVNYNSQQFSNDFYRF